jgi:hypothetical protein
MEGEIMALNGMPNLFSSGVSHLGEKLTNPNYEIPEIG